MLNFTTDLTEEVAFGELASFPAALELRLCKVLLGLGDHRVPVIDLWPRMSSSDTPPSIQLSLGASPRLVSCLGNVPLW
jgi:hypothetical protein